ncbi:MAG: sigma 54-interacting transcriptional regulator [Candidatus Acidiferrales bacterium]
MLHNQNYRFWRVVTLCLSGSIAIALITYVCFRLHLNLATTAFLYLIIIIVLSFQGSFLSAAVVSLIAVGCLVYYFVPPIFSFRVSAPIDVVAITAFLTTSAVITHLVSKVRNLAEELQSRETGLKEAEEKFRGVVEAAPDAIVLANRDGRIVMTNPEVGRMFGYAQQELIGQPVEILVPDRFRRGHIDHRSAYLKRPVARSMGKGLELTAVRKDGSEFPVDIMLGPIERPQGPIVLAVIRDLSQRKKDDEALRRSEQEKRYLEEELVTAHQFNEIIGESSGLKRVLKQVEDVATTDATVLILGETGTGKELIARAIHELSPRRDHAFVKLNCSAIPSGLLESELFGHEKGAFTGAIAQKIGRLELAHQGTFFLDEVGDLPLELQPKILRALQEKEFERVGGTKTIPVDVRLVAATNRDLAKMVANGQFRNDLYYRLRVFPITVPPLRERRDDIPLLVRCFLSSHSKRIGRRIETIPTETMQTLVKWHWPGNVRELENFIERSVILSQGPVLRAPLAELDAVEESTGPRDSNLEAAEREHILRVLRECKGMIGGTMGAAERLGLKRTTLNSKMKKLGIKREDYI